MLTTIANGQLTVSVSDLGAELRSIQYGGAEYLWQGDPAYWKDRSPVLFPFVGRFTDGKYRLNGVCYPMNIHGFAAGSVFTVTEKSECSVTLTLCDTAETYAVYPFHFALHITYTVQDNQLFICYEVQNKTDGTMYFAIGGHPGFRVPLEEGFSFTDYSLQFSEKAEPTRVGHTPSCFLSGHDTSFPLEDDIRISLFHGMFDDDAIVLKNVADTVTLSADGGTRSVTVSYPQLPYLGLWHAPRTDAPYLCIEPWSSLPSRQDIIEDFRFKCDMLRLPQGEKSVIRWSITLQ